MSKKIFEIYVCNDTIGVEDGEAVDLGVVFGDFRCLVLDLVTREEVTWLIFRIFKAPDIEKKYGNRERSEVAGFLNTFARNDSHPSATNKSDQDHSVTWFFSLWIFSGAPSDTAYLNWHETLASGERG